MTRYIVNCNECDHRETTSSYKRAQELSDSHHIVTGHRPPIPDEIGRSRKFTVSCGRCDFRERTDSYERAKELQDNHHIPTGHHPNINEK